MKNEFTSQSLAEAFAEHRARLLSLNVISRENLQMLCPFRACSCAVEGASGNGEEAQLGKTGAKGEAKQRGANLERREED